MRVELLGKFVTEVSHDATRKRIRRSRGWSRRQQGPQHIECSRLHDMSAGRQPCVYRASTFHFHAVAAHAHHEVRVGAEKRIASEMRLAQRAVEQPWVRVAAQVLECVEHRVRSDFAQCVGSEAGGLEQLGSPEDQQGYPNVDPDTR